MNLWFDAYDWNDFCICSKERDVYLFGAAETAETFLQEECIEVKGIFDNLKIGQNFQGILIENPDEITTLNIEKTVIMITCQFFDEIAKQLKGYGVKYFFHYERCSANKGMPAVSVEDILKLSNENKITVSEYFEKYTSYAHALGTIDGMMYTNSLEAFKESFKKGFRVFEADTSYTEGMELILCHPNNKIYKIENDKQLLIGNNVLNTLDSRGIPKSFQEYSKEKIFGKYTPLNFNDWLMIMKEYPSIYYVTHARGGRLLEQYEEMIRRCKDLDESILDRFIVQVHSDKMCKEVRALYPFKYMTFLQFRKPLKNILLSALQLNVGMVTLEQNQISDELMELCHSINVKLCMFNLEKRTAIDLKKKGISLFCMESDLLEDDEEKI